MGRRGGPAKRVAKGHAADCGPAWRLGLTPGAGEGRRASRARPGWGEGGAVGLFITESPRGMLAIREEREVGNPAVSPKLPSQLELPRVRSRTGPAVPSGAPGVLSWLKLLQLRCVQTARKFSIHQILLPIKLFTSFHFSSFLTSFKWKL